MVLDQTITQGIKAVDSGNIRPGAVISPVNAFTDDSISLPKDVETTVQQCSCDASGYPIFIAWSFNIQSGMGGGYNFDIFLYRDSTLIYQTNVWCLAPNVWSANISDIPDEGSYVYYLKITSLTDDCAAKQRSLFLMEIKR